MRARRVPAPCYERRMVASPTSHPTVTRPDKDAAFLGVRLTLLAKMPMMMMFGFFLIIQAVQVVAILIYWDGLGLQNPGLTLIGCLAGAAFSLLIVVTTYNRLDPKLQSAGLAPRICALAGAFLSLTLTAMPPVTLPQWLHIVAIIISITGTLASVWVLRWLGRSFSIMAEARALVTSGPYAHVRHPLYVTETFALLGGVLLHISWLTLLLLAVQLAFQWRRILYEEEVLRTAFPEYDDYARRVPRFFPRLSSRRSESAAR